MIELERRPRRHLRAIWAAVVALALVAAACTDSETVPAEVVEQFETNSFIADLTEPGDEEVPREDLLRASNRARSLGTELRFVIAGVEDELVSASAVVAVYGGTVLSYRANDTAFEAASEDIHGDQIDAAVVPAGQSSNLGDSANAFVDFLESEGLREPGPNWWPAIAWILLALSAVFLALQLWRLLRARKRRAKRKRDFATRKALLLDWAERLGPEVAALEEPIAFAGEPAQHALAESREFADRIVDKVANAETASDLDAAEIRIGRAAIKLRDLRDQVSI